MADFRARDDASLLAENERTAEAFRVFFDRHAEALAGLFRSHRVDIHDAADLLQEVFVAAYETRDRYRAKRGSARTWLFAIAQHKLADRGRRWGREQELLDKMMAQPIPLTTRDVAGYEELTAEVPALDA